MNRFPSWLKYVVWGVAASLTITGIAGSWLLAIKAGERTRLERDAPAVLGTTVLVNSTTQGVLDDLSEQVTQHPEDGLPAVSPQIADQLTTLNSLLAVVDQSKEGGLKDVHADLIGTLKENAAYLEGVRLLLETPILDMASDEPELAAHALAARQGFAGVFRTLHLSPNPYEDTATHVLEQSELAASLESFQQTVLKWKTQYEKKHEAISSFERRMVELANTYDGMRGFDTGSIESGLGSFHPPYYEYDTARSILSSAYSERASLLGQANELTTDAPRRLKRISTSFANVVQTALSGISAAEAAVDEFEYEQIWENCTRGGFYFYRWVPCYKSVTETPSWYDFTSLSSSITGLLEQWERDFNRAVKQAYRSLSDEYERLTGLGVDVPSPE